MAIENNILIDEFMKETTKEQEDDQKFNNLEDMVNYCRIKLYLNEDVDKSI